MFTIDCPGCNPTKYKKGGNYRVMKKYVVLIQNVATQEIISTVCKDNNELATLVSNLDSNKYAIDSIQAIRNVIDDIDHFCVKDDKLETGVQKEEVKND